MTNTIIEQYEHKMKELLKENMELFSENMRLKYGSSSITETKHHASRPTHKRLPMSVMKENKQIACTGKRAAPSSEATP